MIDFAWTIVPKQDNAASMIAHVRNTASLVAHVWMITIGVQLIQSTMIALPTGIHNQTIAPTIAILPESTALSNVMIITVNMNAMKLAKIHKIAAWETASVMKTVPTVAICHHLAKIVHHGMLIAQQLNLLPPLNYQKPLYQQLWQLLQHSHRVVISVHLVHQSLNQKVICFWSHLMTKLCFTTGQREAKNTFLNFKDHTKILTQNLTSTVSSITHIICGILYLQHKNLTAQVIYFFILGFWVKDSCAIQFNGQSYVIGGAYNCVSGNADCGHINVQRSVVRLRDDGGCGFDIVWDGISNGQKLPFDMKEHSCSQFQKRNPTNGNLWQERVMICAPDETADDTNNDKVSIERYCWR